MTEPDTDQEFRTVANAFIDLANRQAEKTPAENVSMALLYAASRFNSFIVAAHAQNMQSYDADRDQAMAFFQNEYHKMLNENLDDYRRTFEEDRKYAHLMTDQPD